MPYALIATEQSIQREDFVEAQRLYALMEKTDYQAPALPRLKKTIADAQTAVATRTQQEQLRTEEDAKKKDLEKTRLAQQQAEQQKAAQQLAAQQAKDEADKKAIADREAAAAREAQQRPAPVPTVISTCTSPLTWRRAASAG